VLFLAPPAADWKTAFFVADDLARQFAQADALALLDALADSFDN
jgi:hypothetical protein